MAITVEIHTRGAGDEAEDAVGDRVGLDVLDVVELASLRNHQLADSVLRIGKARNRIRRRDLGTHLVEARLNRRDGGVPLGRIDECRDRRHHLVLLQRLADGGSGIAVVDLDDDIVDAVAGKVVALTE